MGSHLTTRAFAVVDELFGPSQERRFGVRLWDGSATAPAGDVPFTIIINRPSALRSMFLPPSELAVGEAYIRADYDIEGDIEAAPGLSEDIFDRLDPIRLAKLQALLLRLPKPGSPEDLPGPEADPRRSQQDIDGRGIELDGKIHSLDRDGEAVRFHYDIPPEFWRLWLDDRMVYSCAYFVDEDRSIHEAQEAKLDLVCRKLRLQPGDSLLDIGCGWGSLILYAAEHYGITALGITLSQEQVDVASKRIAAAGLTDRVKVEVRDYRDLPPSAVFDKVASLGMVEHVGHDLLPRYFADAYAATRPGGLFLCHGITNTSIAADHGWQRKAFSKVWREAGFFYKYIFPDSEIPTPTELVEHGQGAGYELRDFESLREHYPLTLRAWRRRLEARHTEVAEVVGEGTYRAWRFYLATSGWAFTRGRLGLGQVLLSKPDERHKTHLPLTRAHQWA